MNPPLVVSSFHESNWSNPFKKDTVFISRHFLRSSIITRSQWLIWENLKGVFIWGKPLSPCSFKSAYLFHRTSCTVVQLHYRTVLNTRKHLQPSHFHLTISQQQLQLFIMQGWLLEQLLSPKNFLFGVLIAWIFFQGTVVFGSSYC